MSNFSISLSAYRELALLPERVAKRIAYTVSALAASPMHALSTPVSKTTPEYRSIGAGYYCDILYLIWEEGIEIVGVIYRPVQSMAIQ